MQAVGDEPNDSPPRRPRPAARLRGVSAASPDREHLFALRHLPPVRPVAQIAEHPGLRGRPVRAGAGAAADEVERFLLDPADRRPSARDHGAEQQVTAARSEQTKAGCRQPLSVSSQHTRCVHTTSWRGEAAPPLRTPRQRPRPAAPGGGPAHRRPPASRRRRCTHPHRHRRCGPCRAASLLARRNRRAHAGKRDVTRQGRNARGAAARLDAPLDGGNRRLSPSRSAPR